MTAKQLYEMLKSKLSDTERTYLFLDEVQEISSWEKAINSINTDFDVDIYVTGSNSRMMSSEISTYLTGRYVTFRIYVLVKLLTEKLILSPPDKTINFIFR